MTTNNAKALDPNRRVCDRLDLCRKILLELANGEILVGETVDISLRGALMKTDITPGDELLGVAGTLFMIASDGQHSSGYPCKVVRLEGDAIGLELDKKAVTAFGQYMTRDLFRP